MHKYVRSTKFALQQKVSNLEADVRQLREVLHERAEKIELLENAVNTLESNIKVVKEADRNLLDQETEKWNRSITQYKEEVRYWKDQAGVYYRALMLTQAALQACPPVDVYTKTRGT